MWSLLACEMQLRLEMVILTLVKLMKTQQPLLIVLGLLLFHCGPLLASESEGGDLSLKVHSYGVECSTVDMGDAAYSLRGVSVEAQKCHWQLGVMHQAYDWRNPDRFGVDTQGRDPWGSITRLTFGFSHAGVLSEQWSGQILAGVSGEFEDELDDSLAVYAGGYGVYRWSPRLHAILGIFYSHHAEVETDFDVVPVIGLAWNPEAATGFSARLGLPVTQAQWTFDPQHRLLLDLNTLQGGVTRLADDNPLRPGGYIERVHASLVLRYETQFTESFLLSTGVGYSLEREITLYDSDGSEAFSSDVERGTSIEITLCKTF